ncbi:MAG: phosphate ABC transporter substrate-binding protein PstS [Gaiellaceae bacterium]
MFTRHVNRWKLGALGILAISAVAAGVLASAASPASNRTAATKITGAGSSFVFPLVSQWIPAVGSALGIDLTYASVGSGAGIAQITARTVDFGASDAPMTSDQFSACKGCVQIPWALAATSIPYNLPGLTKQVKLTGTVIAGIYLGQITTWNAPAIKALNPGLALPSTKITPVYRSDNSGTSYNITDYLSTVSPAWKAKIGTGVNASWPTGVGGKGSSGVSGVIKGTVGAIGYVDIAYALSNKLQVAAVKNRAGVYAQPGLRGIAAAGATIKSVPSNNELHIVDPPKTSPKAYPICTFTYVILPTSSSKAADLRKLVFWALTKGQTYGPKLLFSPIPKVVLAASEKTLKQVQG